MELPVINRFIQRGNPMGSVAYRLRCYLANHQAMNGHQDKMSYMRIKVGLLER